jgi:FkbM family methyltransferase
MNDISIKVLKKLIDINESLFFERRLRSFYKRIPTINTVIDVGANKGQSIDFFLKINPECKIFSFEPNPNLFKLITNKYKTNPNIRIFNFGVSEYSGEKIFFENIFDYTSSFEELNMNSVYLQKKSKILGVKKDALIKRSYHVKTISLKEFIETHKISKIDVLKIDTEGHEYSCLLGLFKTPPITNIRYIQLEHHEDDMYKNKNDFSQMNLLLTSNKFFLDKKIKHGFGNFYELIYRSNLNSR